ncbi:MAG: membrane dipeptidase, partial [Deltaproteobacteria bacterium]|nr:membrane dipeptidase [Deltaproteobacteria bacterium]
PAALLPLLLLGACGQERLPVEDMAVDSWAHSCVSLRADDDWLVPGEDSYRWAWMGEAEAARFRLQAADLGVYLLKDADGRYLVAETDTLGRVAALESDITRVEKLTVDDGYISGGEWEMQNAALGGPRVQLFNRRNERFLGRPGLVDAGEALAVTLEAAQDCAGFPELSVDATGQITRTTFDDGTLFGLVDAHSHLLSNFGFGGGGVFHGAPFHRLGVEHALADCAPFHGESGRRDFFGYAFDKSGDDSADMTELIADILVGELEHENHLTAGYPDFPDWPNARHRSTHQVQYYRWLERAWMGGLRLVVQHATTNSTICTFMVGEGLEPSRYDCEDMTAVDRIIDETWAMQDYIDAQSGGAGKGFFRVVTTPADAREVIAEGKLAVVLGIETSDLFRCTLTPRPGAPTCDEAWVEAQLDDYAARGVRSIFPNHKYDNRFTPGDGSGDFIELGNFFNSGHWTNKTQSCPEGVDAGFDGGPVTFGGLNEPRADYLAPAPNDMAGFPAAPMDTALTYAGRIMDDPLEGSWCQNGTFTEVGESLLRGMMARGMIIEVDHLPMWSFQRVFALLEEADYPAAATHGRDWQGRVY